MAAVNNVELGGVDIGTFRNLMSSLVDSTTLYGVEVWGATGTWKPFNRHCLERPTCFLGYRYPPS